MNQMTRTLAFVMAAAASVIGAVIAHVVTRPAEIESGQLAGQPFYPNFQDPTEAASIRIAAWNPNSNKVETFEVVNENGLWRIPSHYDYPADGEEQLARAAASAIGITRGSLVSESSDTYERMGVIDPLDPDVGQGADVTGTRITLKDAEGKTLADFIIGKPQRQVDEDETASEDGGKQQKKGIYYVRRPDEKEVYLAEVAIDVSTKFADWIEKDLLDITTSQLREITVNKYSVDEATGKVEQGDLSRLTRTSSTEKWKLEGLDESEGTVKASVVNAMARALDDLKIVGVRRKPAGLSATLKQEEGASVDFSTALDLQQRGFFMTPRGELLSNEGEVLAGTSDGVMYVLRFGEVFTGTDLEIEVGQSAHSDKEDSQDEAEQQSTDEQDGDAQESDEETGQDEQNKTKSSRYVFVTAQFNQELLGEPPVEPKKPEPPKDLKEKSEEKSPPDSSDNSDKPQEKDSQKSRESSPTDSESPSEESSASSDGESSPAKEDSSNGKPQQTDKEASSDKSTDKESPSEVSPQDPQAEYKAALEKYEEELEAYQIRKEEYDRRVQEGKDRVKELNDRFADWYYVIPADIFDDLSVTRDQLIDPAEEKPKEEETESPAPMPGASKSEETTKQNSETKKAPSNPEQETESNKKPAAEKTPDQKEDTSKDGSSKQPEKDPDASSDDKPAAKEESPAPAASSEKKDP